MGSVRGKRGWTLAAACIATAITWVIVGHATGAEPTVPANSVRTMADEPGAEKAGRGTVTVEVWLVDPEKGNERHPAANATVSIEGTEDRYRTNEKGQTTRVECAVGKVTLHIKVIGADLCKLRDVSVVSGDQVVSVLVEKSQNGKCKRAE
jgi:hypothetical protein